MKSVPPSNFPFSTKFVICKDRHLHIPKPKVGISEVESLNSGINTPHIRSVNEDKDKVHSKQCEKIRQEFTILDRRGWDAEEDNGNLVLSILAAKTFGEFEEK